MSFSKSDIADIYPLSPMQEGMLLHGRLYPESRAYFEQRCYRITGPLDLLKLKEAFNELVKRHAVLRTIFVAEKSKRPLQIVLKFREIPWQQHDLRELAPQPRQQALAGIREGDRARGLDCTRELPLRITLVSLASDHPGGQACYELIWSMHHIVVDGWSVGIIYPELMELYAAALRGATPQLSPVVPFSRYISWLEGLDHKQSLAFWYDQLQGYHTPVSPLGWRKPPEQAEYEAGRIGWRDEPEPGNDENGVGSLAAGLQELATRWQVTAGTIIHTLWGVLLGWYNDSDDLVFAGVVSGRPDSLPGAERLVGLCINTIPVRVRITPGVELAQLAQALQQQALAAADHHFSSLAEIQNGTAVKQELLNHLVAVENFPRPPKTEVAGLQISPSAGHEQINYDLALVVVPHHPFELELTYNRQAYSDQAARRMAAHLKGLLQAVIADPGLTLAQAVPLCPEDEQQLADLNATTREESGEADLVVLFQRQAAARPEHPAVVDDEGFHNYRELGSLAARIAGYLIKQADWQPGEVVAVILGRDHRLPAALWGILQAGGTYLPLDPKTPAARVSAILKDCRCRWLLTLPQNNGSDNGPDHAGGKPTAEPQPGAEESESGAAAAVADHGVSGVNGDRLPAAFQVVNFEQAAQADAAGEVVPRKAEDPAYIIYTSGSTGTPKGVLISRGSLLNFAAWFIRYYQVNPRSRSTLFFSPAFDASILEMVPLLAAGGSLYCLKDNLLDGEGLIEFYRRQGINLSLIPPLLCEEVCRLHRGRLPADFKLLTGGESLRNAGDGSLRVFNNYGPTEGTVVATAVEVSGLGDRHPMPIGFPIDNCELLILDHHGRIVPPGAAGELYLGGAGVALGYLGREDLTRERFLPHPLRPEERVYRTGDRVRFLPEYGLEFLGRVDSQLKIRGFRIEPAEVEQALLRHPAVAAAAVVARQEAAGAVLCAVLVPRLQERVSAGELTKALRVSLPEYLIPTRYLWLESLPLTVSGKVDRAALEKMPLPDSEEPEKPGTAMADKAPLTPLEARLATIWREVIGVAAVGRNDNFFALGGHSLSATRVASRIRQELNLELPLRVIFDLPVLSELAAHLATMVKVAEEQQVR